MTEGKPTPICINISLVSGLHVYVQRSHTSRCQVDDPDGVVVGVRNVEFPLGGSQPRRLIKLSDIGCAIPETSLTGPAKAVTSRVCGFNSLIRLLYVSARYTVPPIA